MASGVRNLGKGPREQRCTFRTSKEERSGSPGSRRALAGGFWVTKWGFPNGKGEPKKPRIFQTERERGRVIGGEESKKQEFPV